MNDLFVRLTECDFCRISYIKHIGHADCSSYASKVYLNTGEVLYSTKLPDDLVCEIDRINKNYNDNNLQKENKQLKDNWNELKKIVKSQSDFKQKLGNDRVYFEVDELLDKMQELENGDSNAKD